MILALARFASRAMIPRMVLQLGNGRNGMNGIYLQEIGTQCPKPKPGPWRQAEIKRFGQRLRMMAAV